MRIVARVSLKIDRLPILGMIWSDLWGLRDEDDGIEDVDEDDDDDDDDEVEIRDEEGKSLALIGLWLIMADSSSL